MIKKVLLWSLGITLLICVGFGIWLYTAVNQTVEEKFAGSCTAIPLENASAEDIQIDRARGLAYLSLFDRMAGAQGEDPGPGTIGRLDMNMNPPQVTSALQDGPALHPHGLSLHINESGERYLFVINHINRAATGEEAIELYTEMSPGVFSHKETFKDASIVRANDMVAVGPRQFYVVQDVDRRGGQVLTDLVYFDGAQYSVVANDIQSGGGINVSADNSTLYIAETGGKNIRVMTRNPDGSLVQTQSIDLGTSPDNIDIAADGSLWVGAHSNVVALAMHFIAGSKSPSQILRVEVTGNEPIIEEIYMNAGDEISSGSGGATLGNQLLIGSITARKLLLCEMEG